MKATQKISLLAAVAAVALCCGSACADSPKAPIAKHVVLIGVDGFGARWIPWDKMPNLRALRDGGLYATGRDSYPTSSAINWATAFFGTVVEVHGYRNWNSAKPDIPPPPAALEGGRQVAVCLQRDPPAGPRRLHGDALHVGRHRPLPEHERGELRAALPRPRTR